MENHEGNSRDMFETDGGSDSSSDADGAMEIENGESNLNPAADSNFASNPESGNESDDSEDDDEGQEYDAIPTDEESDADLPQENIVDSVDASTVNSDSSDSSDSDGDNDTQDDSQIHDGNPYESGNDAKEDDFVPEPSVCPTESREASTLPESSALSVFESAMRDSQGSEPPSDVGVLPPRQESSNGHTHNVSSSIIDSVKSRKNRLSKAPKVLPQSVALNPPSKARPPSVKPPKVVQESSQESPMNDPPSGPVHFPPKTVRRIMSYLTGAHDIRVSHPSVRAVSVAMECFIREYSKEAFRHSQKKGRNVIRYEDVAYVGNHFSTLHFLQGFLPEMETGEEVVKKILENAGVPEDEKDWPPLQNSAEIDGNLPDIQSEEFIEAALEKSSLSHISSEAKHALRLRQKWKKDATNRKRSLSVS